MNYLRPAVIGLLVLAAWASWGNPAGKLFGEEK